MNQAPDRIWLKEESDGRRWWFSDQCRFSNDCPEYVRADLDRRTADDLRAENERLRALLQRIASSGRCDFAIIRDALRDINVHRHDAAKVVGHPKPQAIDSYATQKAGRGTPER